MNLIESFKRDKEALVADPSFQELDSKEKTMRIIGMSIDYLSRIKLDATNADDIIAIAKGYCLNGQFGQAIAHYFRFLMFLPNLPPEKAEDALNLMTSAIEKWDSVIAAPYLVRKLLKKHSTSPLRSKLETLYRRLCERAFEQRKEVEKNLEQQGGRSQLIIEAQNQELQNPKTVLNAQINLKLDKYCSLYRSPRKAHREYSNILPEVAQLFSGTGIEPRLTEKGISLFATRDFRTNEVVLQDQNGIWCQYNPSRCHHCCQLPKKPLKCENAQCSRIFCTKRCQDEAQLYHPAFCGSDWKELQEVLDSSYASGQRGIMIHLKLAGLFAQRRKDHGPDIRPFDQPPLHLYARATDLARDEIKITECALRDWAMLCCMTVDEDLRIDPLYDLGSYLQLESIIATNAFGAYCGERTWKGCASVLATAATFFNHSCDANVAGPNEVYLNSSGRTVLTFFAEKNIKKGDELTKCYIDGDAPVADRQALLQQRYHFRCTCTKCTRELSNN